MNFVTRALSILIIPISISIYNVSHSSIEANCISPIVVIPAGSIFFLINYIFRTKKSQKRALMYIILALLLMLYILTPPDRYYFTIYYGPFIITPFALHEPYVAQIIIYTTILIFALLNPILVNIRGLTIFKKRKTTIQLITIILLCVLALGYALIPPIHMRRKESFSNSLIISTMGGDVVLSYSISLPVPFDEDSPVYMSVLFSAENITPNSPIVLDILIIGIKISLKEEYSDIFVSRVSLDGISMIVPPYRLHNGFSVDIYFTVEIVTIAVPFCDMCNTTINIKI